MQTNAQNNRRAALGACLVAIARPRHQQRGQVRAATNIWNEFLFAVILTRPDAWPVTVALNNLAGSQIVQWTVQMAGALLAALPTLVVYVILGRFFLRGLMAGALKG